MINLIYQIIRTVRPRQWLKNLSLLAAPVLSGRFFEPEIMRQSIKAALVFCVISSGIYIINDIIDAPKDRQHPIKKNRPIASRKLSEKLAWPIAFVLIFGGIYYSALHMGTFFSLAIITYVLMQLFYSLYLRNVIILDSLIVAAGFVIRVFAGGLATNISLSSWLLLSTIGLSLLLAFGKRRSEKTILKKHSNMLEPNETRKTLQHYPDSLLDSMISMSSTFCIISYALFAFQTSGDALNPALKTLLPSILSNPKWMMLTIPLVIYGVARYLYVIYEREDAESPERVLLSDKPLLLSVLVWGATVIAIIYWLPFTNL